MQLNAIYLGMPHLRLPQKLLLTINSALGRINETDKRKWIMRINLTTFLLIIALAQVYAKGFGQKITLNENNAPLEKVLKSIRQQSGYEFIYDVNDLKGQKISIKLNSVSVEDAVKESIRDLPLAFKIVQKNIVLTRIEPSFLDRIIDRFNAIDVRGVVVDSLGNPLQGATVKVKGSSTQVNTNARGEFYIANVDENAVLVVSYVGYQNFEISLKSASMPLAIRLYAVTGELKEVRVNFSTGYQEIPKERATGAFELINNEQLNRRAGIDILSRLEGVATGIYFDKRKLTPSQTALPLSNIIIRGLSTLTETMKQPLIIVNNFPYEQDINNINPNDVEDITLLKDAAAASIWGARAANGVIVIRTKQGQFNQPLQFSFSGNITLSEKPDLFVYPSMSVPEFIENETFLFNNGFYNADISNTNTGSALTPVVEMLARRRDGVISGQDSAQLIRDLFTKDLRSDFEKYIYRKSAVSQYALSLSGGSNMVKYSFGVGYDKNLQNLIGNEYERINFRSDISIKPVKNFDINLATTYTNTAEQLNSLGDYGASAYEYKSGLALYPYARLADDQGNPLVTPKDYRTAYADTAGAGKLLDWRYKALDEMKNIENKGTTNNLLLNFSSLYKLSSYLSLTGSYQYELSNGDGGKLMNVNSFFTRNLINLYTEILPGGVVNNIPVGGILDQNFFKMKAQAGRLQLNLNKNWETKHQIVSVIGTEIRGKRLNQTSYRTYGYNDNTLSTASVDYVNRFPIYGGRGSATISPLNSITKTLDRFVSYFGNAAYTYLNKYVVSVSARKDAANLFGININDKWKPFWTVGMAWNVSNEKFMKTSPFNFLKLRGSYGYQGNVNNTLSPYTILNYAPAYSSPINQPFATVSQPANPGLSWETIKQINIGLDYSVFNDRIRGAIDIYNKSTNNLILRAEIDPTTGISSVFKNSASMTGRGIDVSINSANLKGSNFNWNTEYGISHATTKVKDFLIDDKGTLAGDFLNGGGANGLSINPKRGASPYSIFSYPFAGLDPLNGNPLGYLGKTSSEDYQQIFNQLLDTADLVYHGSAIPIFFGYLNNMVTYKGISLAVNINYKLGYYFRKKSISYYRLNNSGLGHADYSQRWQQPGDERVTSIPSRVYPTGNNLRDDFYAYSTATVLKGDHVRLQFIRIGYDFGKVLIHKTAVRNLQLYMIFNNLGTIWKANKESLDPDYDPGLSFFPPPKSVVAGIKVDL